MKEISGHPNFGYPSEYGCCQRDDKDAKPDMKVTTREIWDWKENVRRFLLELNKKRSGVDGYIDKVKSNAQTAYEDPPQFQIPYGGASPHATNAVDALTITAYNGVRNKYTGCMPFDSGAEPGSRWSWSPPVAPGKSNPYIYYVLEQYHTYLGEQ